MNGKLNTDNCPGCAVQQALSALEPRTAEAVIDIFQHLVHLLEWQHKQSLDQCYARDAQHAAREQLLLDLYDDSDITTRAADNLPF